MKDLPPIFSLTKIWLVGLLLAVIFPFGCKLITKKPDVRFYGPPNSKVEKFAFVELARFVNYDSLCNRVDSIVCHDSIPVIEMIEEDTFKYLRLINRCPIKRGFGDFKSRNVLEIWDDQCDHGSTISMDSLAFLLYQFIINPDDRADFAESPKKALIFMSFQEKGIIGLTSFLERFTKASELAGVTNYLIVDLKRKRFRPPPPPLKIFKE